MEATITTKQVSSALKLSDEVNECGYGCEPSHPGWIFTERGVKECECKRLKYRSYKLSQIPPAFSHIDLKTMTPQRHKKQSVYLSQLRHDPYRSLVLLGPHGCGKTSLAIAVYRLAIEENRPAVFTYLPSLLNDLQRAEFEDDYIPIISVAALSNNSRNAPRWLIVIDDFNVGRATRFTGVSLLNILNTAINYNHQVVITAHCTMPQLKQHWEESGEGYGGSIIRRIEESKCSASCASGALVMNFFAKDA